MKAQSALRHPPSFELRGCPPRSEDEYVPRHRRRRRKWPHDGGGGDGGAQRVEPGPTVETDAASSLSPHPPQPSFIAPPSTSPSPPPSALFDCRVSADFYAFISIFTPPPLRHQTDILMLLVVVLPFAHLMDFSQTEHRRRRP